MNQFQRQNNPMVQNTRPGIQAYMAEVYGWMTVGLLLTAFVAWYTINNSNIVMYVAMNNWVLISLLIAKLALVGGLSSLLPQLSGGLATAIFMLYSAMTGVTISLTLVTYTGASVANTFFVTSAMFGALSLYGYTTKRSLKGMGNFLFMSLIGLLIAMWVNIWLEQPGLTSAINYAGILIFSALTAYDTQKLEALGSQIDYRNQETVRKYAILGALELYLDFINLFLMLLRIMGERRNQR